MDLEIVPNSSQFKIMAFNDWTNALKIKVTEKALKGKANKELLEKLEKVFKTKIEILQGEKSRKKKILLRNISKKEIIEKLLQTRP